MSRVDARLPVPLPALGFGAAQLGNLYRVTTDDEADGAVAAAWDAGIRYFDTAPHYGIGTSERRLGERLQAYPREDYLVSTKVGRLLEAGPGTGDDTASGFWVPDHHVRRWDMSEAGVRASLQASLLRLGLDHVDILYLHDPEEGPTEQAFTEALPALTRMREEGLVAAIGVGSKDADVCEQAVRTGLIDLVMLSGRYTLLEQDAASGLLEACLTHDVQVVDVSVFNSGLLSRPVVPEDAPYEYEPAPAPLIARARELAALAERHGATLPDLAVQYPLRHPAIASVVLGMRTAEHVRSNVARLQQPIPDEAWADVAALEREGSTPGREGDEGTGTDR
ncbi:aldo/keto reductase [Brachybacterium endophyticum]|uniref:Aldo/keto reductase n=1 Tax=Brachybacterium endophyticum TaxID=2182385 RepID=A0A2U2RMY5_9MICO|nr:aldo/keto reductase [Brachybacterium endophyticum]PWH07247.1 aldo/keto reductase [Brachybacterium endophyticum]